MEMGQDKDLMLIMTIVTVMMTGGRVCGALVGTQSLEEGLREER